VGNKKKGTRLLYKRRGRIGIEKGVGGGVGEGSSRKNVDHELRSEDFPENRIFQGVFSHSATPELSLYLGPST